MNNDQLKRAVMRRVYVVYAIKWLTQSPVLEFISLCGLVCFSMIFISLRSVITNASTLRHMTDYPVFFTAAFFNTKYLAVKFIAVIGLVISGKLAWETVRGVGKFSFRVGERVWSYVA